MVSRRTVISRRSKCSCMSHCDPLTVRCDSGGKSQFSGTFRPANGDEASQSDRLPASASHAQHRDRCSVRRRFSRAGRTRAATAGSGVPMLLGKPNEVEIHVYTPRYPLKADSPFADIWQPSFARCQATMKYLVDQGIDAERGQVPGAASGLDWHATSNVVRSRSDWSAGDALTHPLADQCRT